MAMVTEFSSFDVKSTTPCFQYRRHNALEITRHLVDELVHGKTEWKKKPLLDRDVCRPTASYRNERYISTVLIARASARRLDDLISESGTVYVASRPRACELRKEWARLIVHIRC